jgi:hypothetical protein
MIRTRNRQFDGKFLPHDRLGETGDGLGSLVLADLVVTGFGFLILVLFLS